MPETTPLAPEKKNGSTAKSEATAINSQVRVATKEVGNTIDVLAGIKPKEVPKSNKIIKKESALKAQHRDIRSQPDYNPVKLIFLSGPFKGRELGSDFLGLFSNEISHDQTADWSDGEAKNIRAGSGFKQISSRTFSFSLTLFSLWEDISYLGENLAHLQEIAESEVTPPLMALVQGTMTIQPVVCTSLRWKYSEPHPDYKGREDKAFKNKGFRRVDVDMSLKLLGGIASEHALGKPLNATPLGDEKARTTAAERARQGDRKAVKITLADCLSEKANDEIQELLKKNQLLDIEAIAALDPHGFVQAAVGGLFNPTTLSDPKIKEKLHRSLALVIAESVDGLQKPKEVDPLKEAILGNPQDLRSDIAAELPQLQEDLKTIEQAVSTQNLGEDSDIFKSQPTDRLYRKIASCGIRLRQNSLASLALTSQEEGWMKELTGRDDKSGQEEWVVQEINKLLASNPSDEKLKEMFDIQTQAQLTLLKNGRPYSSKDAFVIHVAQGGAGVSGQVLWQNYIDFRLEEKGLKAHKTKKKRR